jgi:apolipoprotein N-acyltransferase
VSVHGVSALIVFVAVAIVWLWAEGWRRAWRPAALCLGGVAICVAWGAYRLADGSLATTGTPVRVGIVQGNVPQDQKWDPEHVDDILGRYLRLTREAAARGATVVIWPESSTPFLFGHDQSRTDAVRAAAFDAGIHLVIGSNDVAPEGRPYYNAAFMIDPHGTTRGVYHKMQLVPFGEYIPMRNLLFFAQPLVEGVADFAPGESMTLLPVGERRLSVAVCYEVVFPWHGLLAARTGSELLTTITNDAWYGTTSAPHQHFEQARVRAVETGRYLVRAANTGISAIVAPNCR